MEILISGRWKILELSCQTEEQEKNITRKCLTMLITLLSYQFLACLRHGAWGRARTFLDNSYMIPLDQCGILPYNKGKYSEMFL